MLDDKNSKRDAISNFKSVLYVLLRTLRLDMELNERSVRETKVHPALSISSFEAV